MATLKNTTFSGTANIVLPTGITAQRPGSPVAGMVRFSSSMNLLEFWDGTNWRPVTGYSKGSVGTGGDLITYTNKGIVHRFTTVGSPTFTQPLLVILKYWL
jgi:hypothetical protein